jgi:hypothetical protein
MKDRNQRWREGATRFVTPRNVFDPRAYDVAAIDGDSVAKRFVVSHHYSGSYPAARQRYGLYRHGELAGVAVFSHPCRDDVLTNVFPGTPTDSVELGRFVLLDDVGFNGETWFLARAFDLLRTEGLRGVVSFSDPMPRKCATGAVVFAGHIGTIYQAFNGTYLGQAPTRTIRLLPDGRTFSARAMQKIRSRDQGWEYSAAQLVAVGAAPLSASEDSREWLRTWLPTVTRAVRHPGNLKYAWALDRRTRRVLPPSLPYVKRAAA